MATQVRNADMVDLLSTDFVDRNESAYAWKSAVSALVALPGVRGAWPMSSIAYAQPECLDVSGNGNHLQAAAALGNVTFGQDPTPGLAQIAIFGGAANQYLTKADGGAGNWADILGTEAYIAAANNGMTLGGWFWWTAPPGAQTDIMNKDDLGAQRSYRLHVTAADALRILVNGAIAVTSADTVQTGWNHCVGRYDQPSQTVFVYLNGTETAGVAGAAPAALNDSTAPFCIGASGAGSNLLTGYASLCFLLATSLSATSVFSLFESQRAIFGV